MRKLNLSVFLLLAGFCAIAQSDYLITTKSDTISGEIRLMSYDKLDRVQISNKGKKETYTALQVLMVNMDSINYKPLLKENTVRLMRVLKQGYLSLYAFNYPNQTSFDGRYLVKLDGATLEMPNISFKKMMANFLEDCPELSGKLKKGEFGKADINTIIDEYNICVTQLKPAAKPSITSSEEMLAIQSLTTKITEATFDNKQDALDILRDMQSKIEKKENVSKYLIEGLETVLKDQPTLSEDLNKLLTLLKK